MRAPFPLSCVGRDGVSRVFQVDITEDEVFGDALLHVRVRPPPDEDVGHWFDLTLHKCSPRAYRIGMIDRNKVEYGGKGIPDALLPELAARLGVEIWSSVKWNDSDPSERRTESAEKMWKRIMAKGLAMYVAAEDRYVCRM
jgi:hypothetical protein